MNYKELIEKIRKVKSGLLEDGASKCATVCEKAADAIEKLLSERDAAVAELERIAEFTETDFLGYLDNTIHRECGYEYYCCLFDLLCQVTHWEYDDKWRGHKNGKSNGS